MNKDVESKEIGNRLKNIKRRAILTTGAVLTGTAAVLGGGGSVNAAEPTPTPTSIPTGTPTPDIQLANAKATGTAVAQETEREKQRREIEESTVKKQKELEALRSTPTQTATPSPIATKTGTPNPNTITIPIDNLNDLLEKQVQGRLNVERTAISKLPTPTPVVIRETRIENRGGGAGQGILPFILGGLVGGLGAAAAFTRSRKVQEWAERLKDRFGGSPPNNPPAVNLPPNP